VFVRCFLSIHTTTLNLATVDNVFPLIDNLKRIARVTNLTMNGTFMLKTLTTWILTPWYWLIVAAIGFGLEGVALFYQHILNQAPCVLCIHARVWTLIGTFFALLGLALHRSTIGRLVAQSGLLVSLACLLYKSWLGVLIERGLYESSCNMDAGFPTWLPLNSWFPNVFEVWAMCGSSPELVFGLSMVEGLTYGSIALIVVASVALILMIKSAIDTWRLPSGSL
jgi:disulfide bond formation protein DsbB